MRFDEDVEFILEGQKNDLYLQTKIWRCWNEWLLQGFIILPARASWCKAEKFSQKKERREKRCGGKGKTKEKEKEKGKGRARSCRQLSFAQHKRTQKKPWEQGTAGRPTPSSPFLHLTAYPLGPSLDKQRQGAFSSSQQKISDKTDSHGKTLVYCHLGVLTFNALVSQKLISCPAWESVSASSTHCPGHS